MVELLPVLGSLGGGGAMVAVIIYLLANNRADRAAASDRIKAAHDRADEAEVRAREARAAEDAERRRANAAEATISRLLPDPVLPAVDPTAPPARQAGDGP